MDSLLAPAARPARAHRHGRARCGAGGSAGRFLRAADRIHGPQPPGGDLPVRLAQFGARGGRQARRGARALVARGRTHRAAGASGGALHGRPGGALHDRRWWPRQRHLATHPGFAQQPLRHARHAQPRFLRGGALAHGRQPDAAEARAARFHPQHQRHHRSGRALPRPDRAAALCAGRSGLHRARPVEGPQGRDRGHLADLDRRRAAQRAPDLAAPAGRAGRSGSHGLSGRHPASHGDGLPGGDARRWPLARPQAPGLRCHRRGRRHRHLGFRPAARRAYLLHRGHRTRRPVHPDARLPRPA